MPCSSSLAHQAMLGVGDEDEQTLKSAQPKFKSLNRRGFAAHALGKASHDDTIGGYK